ncbi:MAG: DUF2200 domain-containing protein [Candidatus Izemoplasmatales bacterium]
MKKNKIYDIAFSTVYPLYIQKIEKKGREKSELDQIIYWLTGYNEDELHHVLENNQTMTVFFERAPRLNPNRSFITGSICGVIIQDIEEDLMKNIRYLDKLVDELAKGKALEKILRSSK